MLYIRRWFYPHWAWGYLPGWIFLGPFSWWPIHRISPFLMLKSPCWHPHLGFIGFTLLMLKISVFEAEFSSEFPRILPVMCSGEKSSEQKSLESRVFSWFFWHFSWFSWLTSGIVPLFDARGRRLVRRHRLGWRDVSIAGGRGQLVVAMVILWQLNFTLY